MNIGRHPGHPATSRVIKSINRHPAALRVNLSIGRHPKLPAASRVIRGIDRHPRHPAALIDIQDQTGLRGHFGSLKPT